MGELAKKYQGGMVAAMKLAPEVVEAACAKFEEVWPVNYNCPGQISCAGKADSMDAFVEEIKAQGGRAVKLAVSGAQLLVDILLQCVQNHSVFILRLINCVCVVGGAAHCLLVV